MALKHNDDALLKQRTNRMRSLGSRQLQAKKTHVILNNSRKPGDAERSSVQVQSAAVYRPTLEKPIKRA